MKNTRKTSGPSRQGTERRLENLYSQAHRCCIVWGCSRLVREVNIDFSEDSNAALGTLNLRTMKIVLNGILLLEQNTPLLHETLCHELAHAAAAIRYGTGIKDHGMEWCEYMEKAGFRPRSVIAAGEVVGLLRLN
jgi:predicted SprT family Zn-dependent metalloprotease